MNILLGVYACEPHNGSEPEVGWQMANELAKAMPEHRFYAITKENNREKIENEKYPDNLKFFYYDPPKWMTFWKKGGRGIRTYYYIWMIGAVRYMKRQKIDFDLVHHITFVNDWLPSFFVLMKNDKNRFVWGPIGSHDPIDKKFLDGTKRQLIEKIRIFLQFWFRTFDPFFYFCKKNADCVIGINDNVRKKLRLRGGKPCFAAEPAIGMKKSAVERMGRREKDDEIFRIVSVGRLVYIKNFKMTILAFSRFLKRNPGIENVKLEIIGEGEDRRSLESLAASLGIADLVEFVGKIPLREVQERFEESDLFLFPTLENAGFVILEAMSHGLPVLAMEYGGPQQFVGHHKSEQLVSPYLPYQEIAEALADRIERFYTDRKLREDVGARNRKDVLENFTWEAKARKMKGIYEKVWNEA